MREYLFTIKKNLLVNFHTNLNKRKEFKQTDETNNAYSTVLFFHSLIISTFGKMKKGSSKSNYIRIKNRFDKYPICPDFLTSYPILTYFLRKLQHVTLSRGRLARHSVSVLAS